MIGDRASHQAEHDHATPEPIKNYQVNDLIKLGYVALGVGLGGLAAELERKKRRRSR